jgi:DNA polymerase I-like protein with 3'-5' exonuclease and polymerase domains
LNKVAKAILRSPVVAVDTETDGLNALRCKLKGVSIAWKQAGKNWAHYWSFDPEEMGPVEAAAKWKRFCKLIMKPLFKRKKLVLVFHNASFDLKVFHVRNLKPKAARLSDTMIMDYLLDENRPHDLKSCAKDHLGHLDAKSHKVTQKEITDLIKTAKKVAKDYCQQAWEAYRDYHKDLIKLRDVRNKHIQALLEYLPARMLKAKVMEQAQEQFGDELIRRAERKAQSTFHNYARKDALWTLELHEHLLPKLAAEGFLPLYWHLYQRVLRYSIEMEIKGVKVNVPKLKKIQKLLDRKIGEIKKKIARRFGKDFKPGSSVQVKHLLWVEMKLSPPPWLKKHAYGKDGLPGSGEEIIEWLVDQGEKKLEDILTFRKLTKTKSTYIDRLIEEAEADPDGRIHTSFSIIKRTARWGSSNPNLQNIPRWDTLKKYIPDIPSIGSCFIPEKGNVFIVADYSQIDLRVMTHCTRDPAFWRSYRGWVCKACKKKGETNKPYHSCPNCGEPSEADGGKFRLGEDVHKQTAEANGLIEKYGYKEGRFQAKQTNFGAIYLMGAFTLAQQLDIAIKEAERILARYHQMHPGVKAYAQRMLELVMAQGYFLMLNGQKRRFDRDLEKINRLERAGSESAMKEASKKRYALMREIMNNTGQGGAAVIINTAIYLLWKEREFLLERDAHLLLQVHDELLIEVPKENAEEVKPWLVERMERAGKLDVPVIAEAAIGTSWEEAK